MACVACSDNDSFTTSRNDLLTFSTDTVKMDTVFANVGSSTYTFWVFNNSSDGLHISTVRLQGGNQTGFRVNVDGAYLDNSTGSVVNDLEVRKGDSIRVFVEITHPEVMQNDPMEIDDRLVFHLESGVEQQVCLHAWVWDALQLTDYVVSRDTVIESRKPIVVYGGLRVDSAATLTLRNTMLYFHDKAGIDIYGRLRSEQAVLRGDRLDHMFDYLPYDRVSGQWKGVVIHSSSTLNTLTDTEIRNAGEYGIRCDSSYFSADTCRLDMERCVVHNCSGTGLYALNANIHLHDCQFTNMLGDCVAIYGGKADIKNCTLAQFYPFSANRGAALRFANYLDDYDYPLFSLNCDSSIMTGYADDVFMGEVRDTVTAFEYFFRNSLIRTPEVSDSVRFSNILWETPKDSIQGKQQFRLIDEQNLIYDFHLDSLSTATGLGCYR